MANTINRLSAVGIKSLKAAGRYSDGQGLYLHIRSNGQGNWLFRYRDKTDGRLRDKGLGLQADVSLMDARDKARECREQLAKGIDPIDQKQAQRQERQKAKAKAKTFGQCVDRYIAQHGSAWRNEKHKQQ
ncbi:MAG TPA: Arm DNA-binding domain-containing protein, partial [Arenimonas sp.]|nr:Arm DNA-binding domain-containing protein [Arenimonas sp.]